MATGPWRFRAAIVLVLIAGHAALFYGIARPRATRSSNTGGTPMFGPVVSQVWRAPRGSALAARPPAPSAADTSSPPSRHWTFPAIDVWPSAAGWSPTLTEFTPVTDAQADAPDVRAAPRRQHLRMVRWLRPAYPADLAQAGVEGSVLLDISIDARGQPVATTVDQSSGSAELDRAAVRAASLWRFAPPLWKSRPVAVTCRIEVRFHSGRDQNGPRGCRGVNRPSIPSAVRSVRRSRPESAIRDNPELRAAASRGCDADKRSHQTVRGNGGIRSEAETAVRYGHDLSSWAASCRSSGGSGAGV